MKIEIKQEHIDSAECRSPYDCAVVKAVNEAIDIYGFKSVIYAPGDCISIFTWKHGDPIQHDFDLPDRIQEFIKDFDSEDYVEPISFELDGLEEFLEAHK